MVAKLKNIATLKIAELDSGSPLVVCSSGDLTKSRGRFLCLPSSLADLRDRNTRLNQQPVGVPKHRIILDSGI
jgi:hypothetical protein